MYMYVQGIIQRLETDPDLQEKLLMHTSKTGDNVLTFMDHQFHGRTWHFVDPESILTREEREVSLDKIVNDRAAVRSGTVQKGPFEGWTLECDTRWGVLGWRTPHCRLAKRNESSCLIS